MKQIIWLIIAAAVVGVTVAILVLVFADTGSHPVSCMARCSMGFFVAVVWIMAIADEVVQVLQVSSIIVRWFVDNDHYRLSVLSSVYPMQLLV